MSRIVVLLLALLTVGATGAAASDFVPAPTLEEVMAAGLGGEVQWFGRAVEIDGVHLHESIAWAAALPPVTSQNAVIVTTRSWGAPLMGHEGEGLLPRPRRPYLIGSHQMPRRGEHLLTLVGRFVDTGQRVHAPVSPTDDPMGYLGRHQLGQSSIAEIEVALGQSVRDEPGMVRVGAAWASVWGPHLAAGLAVVLLWGPVRRSRLWRGSTTPQPGGQSSSSGESTVSTQIGVLRVREAPGEDDPSPLRR